GTRLRCLAFCAIGGVCSANLTCDCAGRGPATMENGMQFMTSLLGDSQNAVLNAAFALGIVLGLRALAAWGLKFARRAGTGVVRGRQRRLTVVDSVQVDGRRQL